MFLCRLILFAFFSSGHFLYFFFLLFSLLLLVRFWFNFLLRFLSFLLGFWLGFFFSTIFPLRFWLLFIIWFFSFRFCLWFMFIEIFSHFINGSKSMWNFIFYFFRQLSIGFVISIWLKHRVPTKISASSRFNDLSWSLPNKKYRLFQFGSHISNNTHRISSLIFKRLNHFS